MQKYISQENYIILFRDCKHYFAFEKYFYEKQQLSEKFGTYATIKKKMINTNRKVIMELVLSKPLEYIMAHVTVVSKK